MPAAVAKRARAGSLGFLVFGFAVNDRGSRFACVFTNPLPNAHYVAASRIDNLATAVFDLLLDRQFRSERRYDHHVFRAQIGNVSLLVLASEVLNSQRGDLMIDLRVVNDFTDDKQLAVFKDFARGIG